VVTIAQCLATVLLHFPAPQDDLIEALRSEGRKQAMNRQAAAVNAKRSQSRGRSGGLSDDAGGEATAEGADTTAGEPWVASACLLACLLEGVRLLTYLHCSYKPIALCERALAAMESMRCVATPVSGPHAAMSMKPEKNRVC
jgi:hypothetical protein